MQRSLELGDGIRHCTFKMHEIHESAVNKMHQFVHSLMEMKRKAHLKYDL
jgi:hypothetical protein